jgi:hypothetical protein
MLNGEELLLECILAVYSFIINKCHLAAAAAAAAVIQLT